MGDIVNLRHARKRKDRRREEADATANRLLFGMTKAERRALESERTKAERELDARQIAHPDEA
jgi:hypothetical protein